MKVALVHDHLAQDGGAEKVLKYLYEIFPGSPMYVTVYDPSKANAFFADKDIRTSFIQKWKAGVKKYKWFLPFMPTAIENFRFDDYDVVISSSSGLAKGVITPPHTLHICYCHTPTRYLWTETTSYVEELPYGKWIKRIIPFYLTYLRTWDEQASRRVDHFIANSGEVAKRIRKFYRQDSTIIYPPVEVDRFHISEKLGNYFLTGGRLVPYKRFDLVVQAFKRLGLPLKVFGTGPEYENLKAIAEGSKIEFLGRVSDEEQERLYRECLAFIHPQVEDFGITAVEVMASGRPVIAFPQGGIREIVKEGVSGVFFEDQNWEALAEAVIRFKPEDYDPAIIRAEAQKFSVDNFKVAIKKLVDEHWASRAQ